LIEPQQNIALARNKAVENSAGQFIAFIDDDEFPPDRWLLTLLEAQKRYQADGVLGPVLPHFDFTPPEWVVKGGIFDRPRYRSGYKMPGHQTRTGNVLLRRSMLEGVECPFRPQFGTGGEDVDFFTRMVAKGCQFVWCDEAVVYEEIPESRCTWRYLVKRALLRGSTFPKRSEHRIKDTITSLIAVPFYTLILPFAALFGRHLIIRYLIRLCDHFARLLAMCGWELMTHREM
jgi:glycosyltransferase involved in cell wall biosynthesis